MDPVSGTEPRKLQPAAAESCSAIEAAIDRRLHTGEAVVPGGSHILEGYLHAVTHRVVHGLNLVHMRKHTLSSAFALATAITFSMVGRTEEPSSAVESVACLDVTVSDLERSIDFYSRVLTFRKIVELEAAGPAYESLEGVFGLNMRIARMTLGQECLELTEYLTPKGRPIPVDARSNDKSFQHAAIVVADMDRAYGWLRENHVAYASTAPQRLPDWNPNARGIRAFYFKDPDGHTLEIIQFPPGKGDPRWQRPSADGAANRSFLGIDHTAIVVMRWTPSFGPKSRERKVEPALFPL